MKTPCLVITYDRVTYTRACVASLERFSDQLDIHLVDHGSTWTPMLEYLAASPHPVHWFVRRSPHALWDDDGGLREIVGTANRYLVTDPDVVLDDACPPDWLDRMLEAFEGQWVVKVGLGLRIDDLPDSFMTSKVRAWENAFWQDRVSPMAFRAPVDTTLAIYPPWGIAPRFNLGPAIRLDEPYLLRHLPWYEQGKPRMMPADEMKHYRRWAVRGSSHWLEHM